MAEPLTTAAIGTVLVKALKEVGLGSIPFTKDLTEKQYLEMLEGMKTGVEIIESNVYFKAINDQEAKQYLSKRPSAEQVQQFFYASLSLGRQFQEKQTISQLQKQQELVDLIDYVKGHLAEIEKNRILLIEKGNEKNNSEHSIEEEDYEVIDKNVTVYEKAKAE
ncbi:7134_t:CDS:2 [Ambispora gerdemannii]|uniref:7134_t:CDS:1 n=1 Tax=Ambispora gerdemannii TaxID=144530 RepID=A0A9N9F5X4_9GLOM|nr:7134_t:CDS:2 [Ambispora gerdemannii]